ncbi:hypothetical protein CRM22_005862 [Opisthorchis felineus]|uniref:LITAF domain-containing protein n=1 Tax=Opisthorchis felineus TaxID=147828 RepID=A0A4S2LNZ2_OPIFE|nr:hypothetical protein CRM22_005862 [Opisthorchis felineus]
MDDKPPPYTAQPAVYPTAPVGSAYPPGHAPYPPPGGAPYPVQAGGPPPAVGFVVPTPAYTTVTVPQATVYVQQPTAATVTAVQFHRHPVTMTCPHCRYYGPTRVHTESGCLAWVLCLVMCFFGLWFGCCLIPFCLDSTKDATHYCGSCHRPLGRYAPL